MEDKEIKTRGILDFGGEEKPECIIKVIGVGGGGGNAVNHMYREGIHDVTFLVCNTDRKALEDSPVPVRLQLGDEGLGAGNKPEKAVEEAQKSEEDIRKQLSDGTRMAFITAGMGGGTGTGASPVVARLSKEMGILTVGIVTIPFLFEGKKKIIQAFKGVKEISKNVDALLVINNERLRKIYPTLDILDAFAKADDTLTVAARSISEIITSHGRIGLDFNDVKTVLKDGGVAIISTGYGEGEERVKHAIEDALNSPLLNDNDIFNSQKILLCISFSKGKDGNSGLRMEEMNYVHDFMERFSSDIETKWGLIEDPTLEDKVKITVLAAGFGVREGDDVIVRPPKRPNIEEEVNIEEIYGTNGNEPIKRRYNIFYFEPQDLDNDEIINEVADLPTYKRSVKSLERIKHLAVKPAQEEEKSDNGEAMQGLISFD